MRLVSEINALPMIKYQGELILELRWFFGKIWRGSVAEYNLPIENRQRFHVNIPAPTGVRWSSFRCVLSNGVVFNGTGSCDEGEGKKNSDYQDLR